VSKKRQDAFKKAQQYISGNKLKKSDVKTLEKKGFSSSEIREVAGSMSNVGDKAQDRIDGKHTKGPGGGKVRTVGTGRNVKVDSQGRAVVSTGTWGLYGNSPGLIINNKQADKINKKVDKIGGSLYGGEGMALSRFVTVTDPGRYQQINVKEGGDVRTGGGKHQLAVYTPIQAKNSGKEKSSKEKSSSGPSTPSAPSNEDQQKRQAYQRAQDHISGRTNQGRPPELFPRGIKPGRAVEGVANYANDLGLYNANYSGWMQDRAEANRYETGRFLENFAAITPKAPDVLTANELIRMANDMNKKIKVG
jgi:hypothetical protein